MKTAIIIPARYNSTRLPGKPLRMLCGKPMIQHVWESAVGAPGIDTVSVATDDSRIFETVKAFGGAAIMTAPGCASGTDRICEALRHIDADICINLQGDEPLVKSEDLGRLSAFMQNMTEAQAATLYAPVSGAEAIDPHLVKVVMAHDGKALYFSRAPIPYDSSDGKGSYFGHIGVYAFRRSLLERFPDLPPSPLEQTEKLEQLRLLQAGVPIYCIRAARMTRGVDTQADLDAVASLLAGEESDTLQEMLSRIKLIITDVDGVLTDGSLHYGPEGETLKSFSSRDGYGMTIARENGLQIAVATGRDCPALRARLKDLRIDLFEAGTCDKRAACLNIIKRAGVSSSETLFLGDDVQDLPGFECCAFGVSVADGHADLKAQSAYVTKANGGRGAFREVVDMIVSARRGNAPDE